ncbi:MAG: SGNH/GDSL hydrolase family protein [Gaiellaceae bacterium]
MPLLVLAAAAAGWFAFWTGEAPSSTPVSVRSEIACAHRGMSATTMFGAVTERRQDGSFGARTSSPLFAAFRVTGPFSAWVEGSGAVVRVRIDGRVATATHVGGHGCTELRATLSGTHRVGLELGLGARLSGIRGETSADPMPDSAPRALFLGDSYTLGVGGAAPPGYAYRAGWAKGWDVRVDAVSGTGFLNRAGHATFAQRLPAVLAQDPEVVVVAGGINDYGNFANAQVAEAARRLFRRLSGSGTQTIVLSPWMPPRFRVAGYRDLVGRIAAAARAARVRYINTSTWLTSRLMAPDGIHPNERGYRAIAARLALRL